MSLYTMACLVILGYFFSSIFVLNTCKKLEGYKFPVYSTGFCPRNESEWDKRASALNCNQNNGYMCLPNENITELLEFCYTIPFIWIDEGVCLYLESKGSYINAYSCSHFIDGCHNTSYHSRRIFDYPACISIGNGCFLAERSCKSSPNTTYRSGTLKNYRDDSLSAVITVGIVPVVLFCFSFSLLYLKRRNVICKRKNGRPKEDHTEDELSQFIQQNQRNNTEAITEGRNPVTEMPNSTAEMNNSTAVAHPFSKGTHQKDVLASQAKAEVSRSIGLIYIDGQPVGTGFRVGEKYIMTCKHVVMKAITALPYFMDCDRVKIEFERKKYLNTEDLNKIFGFQPTIAYIDDEYDVAVLELKHHVANVPFPQSLEFFGEVYDGEIHLVGHPGGRQMKEDSDVTPFWLPRHANIIYQYVKSLSQWSINTFPNSVDYYDDLLNLPRKIMFHTTFDTGSSGSPGFMLRNDKPCVVVMVRAGTPSCFYNNLFPNIAVNDNQKIEYGFAMTDIHFKMWNSKNPSIQNLASEIFREWHTPQYI